MGRGMLYFLMFLYLFASNSVADWDVDPTFFIPDPGSELSLSWIMDLQQTI